MTMQWSAIDNVEPIADSTIEAIANLAEYNIISGCGATYSGTDMVKTIAAGTATVDGEFVTVAGNTVTLVSDPTNPRWTWTYINSSGVAAIISGDPAATPSVPELGANTCVSLDYVQAGLTIASDATYQIDKRVPAVNTALPNIVQTFIENGVYRSLFFLGSSNNLSSSMVSGAVPGIGCALFIDGTSADADKATGGGWTFSTGSTSGEDSGVLGPVFTVANDWTMVAKIIPTSAADQNVLVGVSGTSGFVDGNNIIAFRIIGAGNVIGVCDSGGVETTRDSGGTYDGQTITLRIEVREGGTVVRFYLNNAQVGADVTTNIPTGNYGGVCGIINSTTANKTLGVIEYSGWREV